MRPKFDRNTCRKLIVFGDVHYASYWDHVAEVLTDWDDVINPNAELARFLVQMAAETSPFAAVNLGDAIDYFLCDYEAGPSPEANNRDLFYAVLDAARFICDEIPGNHDHRLFPYNLHFWGLNRINLSDRERRRNMAQLGHGRFRNPLTELRSLARFGSPVDPLRNFRGFRKPTFAWRASFNCIFLNTGGDDLARASGIGLAVWRLMRDAVSRYPAALARPPMSRLSIDCVGLGRADLDLVEYGLRASGPETTIVFMHAPIINPVRSTIGTTIQLTLQRLRDCLYAQGYAHNVIASGGEGLLQLFRSGANADRNVVIVSAHVHFARYILIDKYLLVARQVCLEELNTAWNDARYIKHITALPLGVIDDIGGDNCTGYGRIGPNGFEEVVLRRIDGRAKRSAPPRAKLKRISESARETAE
jgi:hypothetical protein